MHSEGRRALTVKIKCIFYYFFQKKKEENYRLDNKGRFRLNRGGGGLWLEIFSPKLGAGEKKGRGGGGGEGGGDKGRGGGGVVGCRLWVGKVRGGVWRLWIVSCGLVRFVGHGSWIVGEIGVCGIVAGEMECAGLWGRLECEAFLGWRGRGERERGGGIYIYALVK